MRISIRYQLVGLVAGIVIAALVVWVVLARALFTADRTAWLYDYKSLLAGTLSEEVAAHLKTLSDKLSYFGLEQAQHLTLDGTDPDRRARALFDASEDLVALELWSRGPGGKFERAYALLDADRLQALALTSADVAEAARQSPLSTEAVVAQALVVENVSVPPDVALMRVAVSFGREGDWLAVAYVRPDRLLHLFGRSDLHRAWLVDGRGRVVIHPEAQKVLSRADESQNPIVRSALEGKLSRGAETFEVGGEPHLGAFSRVPAARLAVVIEVPQKVAYRALDELNRRAVLFGVAVIAVALLASIAFSRWLTAPLRTLEQTMEVVSRGELGVEAKVHSRNELGRLAEAFNRMSRELSRREGLLIERNNQLVQSEKLSALGELSAGLAHEVKNPMVGIVGFSQLGQTAASLEEATEYFGLIESDALRANEILGNLLEFARPGKVEFNRLDLNAVVHGAVRLVTHPLQIARVRLEVNLAPSLPPVLGNDNQLRQVLVNLMMNAAHAMEASEERRLTVLTRETGGGGVEVELRDTGHGMSEEVRTRLFQPFFSTKARGKGTGLGLSVSRSIIVEHKGDIRVASAPGQGATFTVALPAMSEAAAGAEPQAQADAEPAQPRAKDGQSGVA